MSSYYRTNNFYAIYSPLNNKLWNLFRAPILIYLTKNLKFLEYLFYQFSFKSVPFKFAYYHRLYFHTHHRWRNIFCKLLIWFGRVFNQNPHRSGLTLQLSFIANFNSAIIQWNISCHWIVLAWVWSKIKNAKLNPHLREVKSWMDGSCFVYTHFVKLISPKLKTIISDLLLPFNISNDTNFCDIFIYLSAVYIQITVNAILRKISSIILG